MRAGLRRKLREPGDLVDESIAIYGGGIFAVLASSYIDLCRATLADAGATLRIVASLGTVGLLVPEDWAVNARSRIDLGSVPSKGAVPP